MSSDGPETFGEYYEGEEEDIPTSTDPGWEIGWGYGIVNGLWDVGQRVYRSATNKEPKYQEGGETITFPTNDDTFTRRAFLGTTRDTTAALFGFAALSNDENSSEVQRDQPGTLKQGQRFEYDIFAEECLTEEQVGELESVANELDADHEESEFEIVRYSGTDSNSDEIYDVNAYLPLEDGETEVVGLRNTKLECEVRR